MDEVIIMAFDGIVTRAIVHELNQEISSGRILKVYQPTMHEIILTVRQFGKNKQLLLSSHSSYARIHITNDKYENPQEPSMFCMMLRKYLNGSFIKEFKQIENERIIHMDIETKNEIGDISQKRLIVELMGKHSNIILVDIERNVIIDSIKHISTAFNRHRSIMPGSTYIAPPNQGKINPLSIDSDTFIKKIDFNSGKKDKQIVQQYMGISPLLANEIIFRAGLNQISVYKQVFEQLIETIINNEFSPQIIEAKKRYFYVLPLQSVTGQVKQYTTVSEMLDDFYSGKAERDRVKQKAGDLLRFLANEIKKNERKLEKLDMTLEDAKNAEHYKHSGELLTAHMHLVNFGDTSIEVVDYYDPNQSTKSITLNPHKTPSENAQSFFKKYHKLKKSKEMVTEEKKKAIEEIAYLDEIISQIESAREVDIEEIREELQEQGYLKKRVDKNKKKKMTNKPTPELYFSSDGTEILVGRNNKQNDYLTNKLAKKSNIWLHTKDIPGSHVVIKHDHPSEQTLFEAAQLAANYSKSKHSSTVPVDYTQVKHVKKPNGAKPGFVIYEQQKTLYITPDDTYLSKLKQTPSK